MLFKLFSGGFSDIMNWDNWNSNWKKLLRFRNMQEKLEKYFVIVFFIIIFITYYVCTITFVPQSIKPNDPSN